MILPRDECGDSETRDSFSDSCSDESESEKLWRWDGSSSEEGGFLEQESPMHLSDRLGYLYFQYFERSTPYGRVPLMDKVKKDKEKKKAPPSFYFCSATKGFLDGVVESYEFCLFFMLLLWVLAYLLKKEQNPKLYWPLNMVIESVLCPLSIFLF